MATLEQTKESARRWFKRFSWAVLIIGILSMAGYYFYRVFPYSDGNRAGMLVKISKKGYVFKTYEGQIHLGGSMQMTEQSLWNFSAKNEAVYQKLQQFEGKKVTCHYVELNNAFPWQGDTNYIVDDVSPVVE